MEAAAAGAAAPARAESTNLKVSIPFTGKKPDLYFNYSKYDIENKELGYSVGIETEEEVDYIKGSKIHKLNRVKIHSLEKTIPMARGHPGANKSLIGKNVLIDCFTRSQIFKTGRGTPIFINLEPGEDINIEVKRVRDSDNECLTFDEIIISVNTGIYSIIPGKPVLVKDGTKRKKIQIAEATDTPGYGCTFHNSIITKIDGDNSSNKKLSKALIDAKERNFWNKYMKNYGHKYGYQSAAAAAGAGGKVRGANMKTNTLSGTNFVVNGAGAGSGAGGKTGGKRRTHKRLSKKTRKTHRR